MKWFPKSHTTLQLPFMHAPYMQLSCAVTNFSATDAFYFIWLYSYVYNNKQKQQASRRRGWGRWGLCHTGAGGGGFASDSDFTGNANLEGGTAQAPHVVDGEAHVTIDVTALRQAAALAPEPTETELVSVCSSPT